MIHNFCFECDIFKMVYKILMDKQKLIWDRDIYNNYWPKVTNIGSRMQPM